MTKCDKCFGDIIIIETPNSIHYTKEICKDCGKWFRWIKNPENIGIRTRTSKFEIIDILKFHKYEKSHLAMCFICLRNSSQLGFNETLTRDHIIELDKGGKDEVENLQILCSACHKLKNWARLYMNWHFKE